jgi:hypothetical protein
MRSDLSQKLVHFTKGDTPLDAENAFRNIIKEKALIGSNGGVRGNYNVVCFSEAPIDVLTRVFENPSAHGFRYRPFGVIIEKNWLFEKGGRPVIYQPEEEFELLPEELSFRHVRYEPTRNIDYTFEREWRIKTERLTLEPKSCTLVVPSRGWDYKFREEHAAQDMRKAGALRMNPFTRMTSFDWHFLALDDLGVKVKED